MRQVNLLPGETQRVEIIQFIQHTLAFLFAPTIILLFLISFLMNMHIRHLQKTAEQPLAFQETAETRQLKKQIDSLEKELKIYGHDNEALIKAFVKRSPAAYLLKVISRLSENKVWLRGITLDAQQDICRIDGKSFNTRLVSEFMLEVKRLPYFRDVELVSVGKQAVKTASEVDFQIICYLQ